MTEPVKLNAPRIKTVKRLFSVSSNRCAFPTCTTRHVDESGTVVAEICHISAQSADGPRYDPCQTDEERHGFDNLILMCGIHHKIIDEQIGEYTKERLQEIKRCHESNSHQPHACDDEIADKLLENLANQVQATVTQGSNSSSLIAGRDIVVHSGITATEARQIAIDVFKSNFIQMRGDAQATAFQRGMELSDNFITRLADESPESIKEMASPDMQHVLFTAQREAARSGEKDLSKVLCDLLVARAKESQRDILQLVLNEAIETTGRLTLNQLAVR